jgi:predicted CoA-binding protein/N-acetylglutamate synthase-like GNAT family acetyltransferase
MTRSGSSLEGDGTSGYDVVLVDGSTARVRPINPDDVDQVVKLHARLSPETVRLRYFGAHPFLTPRELADLVGGEASEHLALVAERADQLIALAQYDRLPGSDVAEVAFVVDDAHQGLGIGTLLLEYLASEGRRRGIKRFVADTLFENAAMAQVFRDAGFIQHSAVDAGVVRVVMDISPTPEALSALYERDRVAAARSMERLLRPGAVAVIGASRHPGTVGHELVRNLVMGGFQGPVYPVNPAAAHVASLPAFPSIADVPGKVDLAVIAVPASAVAQVVEACGRKGVRGARGRVLALR